MGNQVQVQTFLKGFEDPALGRISFHKFEDPALGLETMNGRGQIAIQAVELGGGRKLEVTPDLEEIGPFTLEYDGAARLMSAFRQKRPALLALQKTGGSYALTITPQ
jgi:hypothetical protein